MCFMQSGAFLMNESSIGKIVRCGALSLFLAVCAAATAIAAPTTASTIAAAIADGARPQTDTVRDTDRKPAATLAFAGVKPGDRIADYGAGAGYFTRLFSVIVGSEGHVYASVPSGLLKYPNIVKGIAEVQAFAFTHANVSVTYAEPLAAARYPEKLDVF